MKTIKIALAALALAAAGCASNANQKVNAPAIGYVKNEYYLYNIKVDGENFHAVTNVVKKLAFAAGVRNGELRLDDGTVQFGRGTSMFAVDNQVLVGRDIGNAVSNDVNGSISIPFSR